MESRVAASSKIHLIVCLKLLHEGKKIRRIQCEKRLKELKETICGPVTHLHLKPTTEVSSETC